MPMETRRSRRGLTAYGALMTLLIALLAFGLMLLAMGVLYGAPPVGNSIML